MRRSEQLADFRGDILPHRIAFSVLRMPVVARVAGCTLKDADSHGQRGYERLIDHMRRYPRPPSAKGKLMRDSHVTHDNCLSFVH
jgi:hypothetical protein